MSGAGYLGPLVRETVESFLPHVPVFSRVRVSKVIGTLGTFYWWTLPDEAVNDPVFWPAPTVVPKGRRRRRL